MNNFLMLSAIVLLVSAIGSDMVAMIEEWEANCSSK